MNILLKISIPVPVGIRVQQVLLKEIAVDIWQQLWEVHRDTKRIGLNSETTADNGRGEIGCGQGRLIDNKLKEDRQKECQFHHCVLNFNLIMNSQKRQSERYFSWLGITRNHQRCLLGQQTIKQTIINKTRQISYKFFSFKEKKCR